MEHDIYDSLRRTATFYEQLADALNAIAEYEKSYYLLGDVPSDAGGLPVWVFRG